MKIALVIGLLVSLLINALLSYLWVDASVSLTYMKASQESAADAYKRLSGIAGTEWKGLTKREVMQMLEKERSILEQSGEMVVVSHEGDVVFFDSVKFQFEDDKLIGIGF